VIVARCRLCGKDGPHRPRADCKTLRACNDCEADRARAWREKRALHRKLYDTWKGMIRRCHGGCDRWSFCPGVPSWNDYGGQGIHVCRRWRGPGGFLRFAIDVGPPPSMEHTLDRKRTRLGYRPSNVRWATPAEQAANRSNTRWVEGPCPETGQTLRLSCSEWGRRTGIDRRTIARRLDRGWTPAEALKCAAVGCPF
jgi:hypothetical protein